MQLAKVSDARFCFLFCFFWQKIQIFVEPSGEIKKKILIWLYDTLGLKKQQKNKTNFNPLKPYDAKKILPTPALLPS